MASPEVNGPDSVDFWARIVHWVFLVPVTWMIRLYTRLTGDVAHLREDVAVLTRENQRMDQDLRELRRENRELRERRGRDR